MEQDNSNAPNRDVVGYLSKPCQSRESSKGLEPQRDVTLHKAESAWKPKRMQETDKTINITEEFYKKIRSTLNKLAPKKFQTLVKQVSEMEINTEERLQGVADLIFERAISEPCFCVAYASMCRYLAMIKVASTSKQGEYVNFRAILLTRCQKEFDKDSVKEMEEMRKVIAETQDPQKREELCEELKMVEVKARNRSIGNIRSYEISLNLLFYPIFYISKCCFMSKVFLRFIGELFDLKMLTEKIMHDCLFNLLKTKDEERLKSVCELFLRFGKTLDTERAKPRMDQYFNQMDKIIQEKKTSSRVRFMLQDVIDLRKCKWISNSKNTNSKTKTQFPGVQNVRGGRIARVYEKGSKDPGTGMGDNDRLTSTGKANIRVERQSNDPSRLKLTKQNLDKSNIQLGPVAGTTKFSELQRGSTGERARNFTEQEKQSTPSNRFSAFSKPGDNSRDRFGTVPARGDSRVRGSGGFGHLQSRGITPMSSKEQEKEEALAAVRDQIRERRRERKLNKLEVQNNSKSSLSTAKELTEEDMEKETKIILNEYLQLQDIKEAIFDIKELKSPSVMHIFVSSAVNYVLKRSSIERNQTGILLHDLVKKNILSIPVYIQGLTGVIQFAVNIENDIPNIWRYFGELIGPMVYDENVPLNFLRKVAEPLKENNKAGLLVAEVLHAASLTEGHKKVGSLWTQSSLQWEHFMSEDDVKKFIVDNKVEFTEPGWQRRSTGWRKENSMEQENSNASNNSESDDDMYSWDRFETSFENSRERIVDNKKSCKPVSPTAKELTEKEMETKTKNILDEYLHFQDTKEAILCVEKLKSPSVMHLFVSSAVNYVLERSSMARNQTGILLFYLVKKKLISISLYIQGLTKVMQFAENMENDIPNIWRYFGELIGPMIQDVSVPLNFLRKVAEPLKGNNKAGFLVAEVLHAASHREGQKRVKSLWKQSSLQWEDFISACDVKKFIIAQKVEFTAAGDCQSSTPTVPISMEAIQDKLHQLLIKENTDNEVIFDWIEESVDDPTIKSNKFIRTLMTLVCESAITGSGSRARVLPEVIKNRGDLLEKYLDHRAESELQALYAIQSLVHKLEHPQGVLRTLFEILYDEDIISEDGFNQWEKSKDPNEQEGKGVAMKQVVQFFTWLREVDYVSDS
ncbi:eukaryotic translation initiation factor 4 gamma 3-like isoform X1 [Crassostrea angulata]|uniref:eukaryotic translation initiation factor 4 gamma 3-like isoform X1 n=1 Tax=Magallana angulata TaxID=2784310 RepID=UPI0022B1AF58|nr:eukaryotic translation initiation factor 4 gamma 3-like isoform X1 [Crassostrea angulata]XP_052716567.1 eukaryotic translation initiation factor 4 gamma 3-like isoform X1 [Crassostrea angulata]XP_052716568.1 eukaryotic translation initiation factor 4 gamma 3-like isoform X1 [Crassostrea angulata]